MYSVSSTSSTELNAENAAGSLPRTASDTCRAVLVLRDRSLITGRGGGGYKTGGGEASEDLPLRKGGGAEKVLAMLRGGHNKF